MMKKCFILIFLLLLSCSGGGGGGIHDATYNYDLDKALDWQKRETICQGSITEVSESMSDSVIRSTVETMSHMVANDINQVRESDDYWKTSCETLADLEGDCEDIAARVYALIQNEGVIEDSLLRIYTIRSATKAHASVIVFMENEWWVVDPMTTPWPIKVEKHKAFWGMHEVVLEYNLFEIW